MQDIVIIARAVGMVSTVMTTPLRLRVARQQAAPPPRYRKLAGFGCEGAMGTESRVQGTMGGEAYSGCCNGCRGRGYGYPGNRLHQHDSKIIVKMSNSWQHFNLVFHIFSDFFQKVVKREK